MTILQYERMHGMEEGEAKTPALDGSVCDSRAGNALDSVPEGYATLVLRLGYDGAGFSGFAPQEKQTHVRTVAGELMAALRTLLRREVTLACAGRTDAGVHARAQYVSLAVSQQECARLENGGAARLVRSLNAILPDDIVVSCAFRAPAGFSARFDALARTYRYRIYPSPIPALFCAHWAWWLRGAEPLDLDAMREAASCLIGEHDFASFCKASSAAGISTCRRIDRIAIEPEVQMGERLLAVEVEGNAFLHNMIRILVGTLVEVGRGKREPAWVKRALEARNRTSAGNTAPACGLTFWDVAYPQGLLSPWDSA